MFSFFQAHRKLFLFGAIFIGIGIALAIFVPSYTKTHKTEIARTGSTIIKNISKLLPLEPDTKKEIEVIDSIVSKLTEKNGKTWVIFILLQNNYELRPGGGFLGQYAVLKVKDGEVVSLLVEDANLLDQRIKNADIKVTPPWPLTRYMQIKRWMLRDSNFSPDFPFNAGKAEYFYRLGGGREKFDAVIAINATVFDHALELTGPIQVPGYPGTYSSDGGALKLEEAVEKAYLGDDVAAELKENRKNVMKKLASIMIGKLATVENIPKVVELGLSELREKNVMLFFKDESLQNAVESVHWDGSVAMDWNKDYLMVVDANMGALKSDFFVKRSLEYVADFTSEKPKATVSYTYNHTAPYGDWRTSDYHTYTRILAPTGSKYIDQSRLHTGGVTSQDSTDLGKTVFGYKVDVLIGQTLPTAISYELPESVTPENYELLIQKQSGIGNIPVKVILKTQKGEFVHEDTLKKDLRITFAETQE